MAKIGHRSKKLDKDIAKGEKRVLGILRRSQRAVNGVVKQYSALPNFATSATVRNKLYRQLAGEYKILNSDVNKWVESEVESTSKSFWQYAKQDLPSGSVDGTFGKFSNKYVSDIIAQVNPATVGNQVAINAQIGGMLSNDIRVLRAAVSTIMAEAAVEGLTNPQMAKRMTEKVNKVAGGFKFIDKGGRKWSADNYFGMLNRTLHATAARNTYIGVATKELGYDLYVIEGGVTGSSANNPDDPCDDWVRNKRILSMTGNTKGYPTYQDAVSAGVFHPNCVHFVRALLPSEIAKIKGEVK